TQGRVQISDAQVPAGDLSRRFHSVKTPGQPRPVLRRQFESERSATSGHVWKRQAAASPLQLKPCAFAQTAWTVYKLEPSCVALCAPFSHAHACSPYHATRCVPLINVNAVQLYSLSG